MEALRQYLSDHEMTQQKFADLIGVKQPTVWEWLNGKSTPSVARLRRISEATGLSIDELLQESAA